MLSAALAAVLGLAGASKLNALVVLAPVVVVGVAYVWGRARLLAEASSLVAAATAVRGTLSSPADLEPAAVPAGSNA